MKSQETRDSQNTLEKEKKQRFTLLDFKLYQKAMVIKTMSCLQKNRYTNVIEQLHLLNSAKCISRQEPRNKPLYMPYGQLILNKGAKHEVGQGQ